MKLKVFNIDEKKVKVISVNTCIVGSGAAGLNAASRLIDYGQNDICLVSEGLKMGTSRNTGSDKQTYYKVSTSSSENDSVYKMAKTLFDGGSMDGDIALVEAAGSLKAFYRLVEMGVPFPENKFGEFVGYQTDHDIKKRATSAGPLTSKYMTEALEKDIKNKKVSIFDNIMVVKILVKNNKAVGLLALDLNNIDFDIEYIMFNCQNIIFATGGPASMFYNSVYPISQTGMTGIALEAGVIAKNLSEFQFGIGSIKFRWNLSGTYQQVIPRYISTDKNGNNESEFLDDYFSSSSKLINAIFLKGYQWPFDSRKLKDEGSSIIDVAIYNEISKKERRVFLDFTKNPKCSMINNSFNYRLLDKENYDYIKNSNGIEKTPYKRLEKINSSAIDLFKNNGINIEEEYLEIDICPQHCNGGLDGNIWWESNVSNLFTVGEVNGSHGIYRPGGSALNSGQVGSDRSAKYISIKYISEPKQSKDFFMENVSDIHNIISIIERMKKKKNEKRKQIINYINESKEIVSKSAGIIRNYSQVKRAKQLIKHKIEYYTKETYIESYYEIPILFKMIDMHISQYTCLCSIENYIEEYGHNRGSYIIEKSHYSKVSRKDCSEKIQEILYNNGECEIKWRKKRPIPEPEKWFEKVWKEFANKKIYD